MKKKGFVQIDDSYFDQSEDNFFGPSDDDESLPEETPIQKEANVISIPEKSSKKRKSAKNSRYYFIFPYL